MKPSLLASLLLLSFLLQKAQGIRLEKGFMKVEPEKIHDEESSMIERKNGLVGEVIVCEQGQCTTGMNRKLVPAPISNSTTSSKNDEKIIEENKAHPFSSSNGEMSGEQEKSAVNSSPDLENQEINHNRNLETMDLTEMDYTPARRKPPIHN